MREDEAQNLYLTFELGREHFAVKINNVREVLEYETFTRVPRMPSDMKGVINIRGAVIPVISVAMRIGLAESSKTSDSRIVLLDIEYEGESLVLGMLSDRVNEVIDIQPGEVEPPPTLGNRVKEGFVEGVGKKGDRFILILNLKKLLLSQEQFT